MRLRKKYNLLIKEIKDHFLNEGSGHDWLHINRVINLSLQLQEKEGGNREVIFLAALLHDVGDHKFHNNDYSVGPKLCKNYLNKHKVTADIKEKVLKIRESISFSKNAQVFEDIEGQIVQDADRLDAMGYMGIARCFSYGGNKSRPIFSIETEENSLQHFDDKLLKLYALLNTDSARVIGKERHKTMLTFKNGFIKEWNLAINDEY